MKSKIIAVALFGMLIYSCASKPVATTLQDADREKINVYITAIN